MDILKKLLILFIICYLSDIASSFLPFPFPGSVLAMIILFLCLLSGLVKPHHVEPVSRFLLNNMALIFVPSTVSIISYVDVLSSILWRFLFICIITTLITFVCTAYAVKLTIYFLNKRKGNEING